MKETALPFCLAAVALGVSVSTSSALSWPEYRGPNGDGVSPEKILSSWPAAGPKRLWSVPSPAGFSSLSIEGGKAFTVVARDSEGALSEVCVALDANTGKELWATPFGIAKYPGGGDSGEENNKGGDGPRSTPSVDGSRVYVYSADMALCCLEAGTGKLLWKKDIIREFGGKNISWKNAVSPVIDGELVYIAGGGAGQSMLAFNKGTGAVVWKTGNEAMTHASPVVTTLHGVRQVIYIMQSGLVALDAAKGELLWKQSFPYRTSTACLPVIGDGIVFCTAGYDIGSAAYQVAKEGGTFTTKELWRVKGNRPVASLWSPPVYKDGALYGVFSFKQFGKSGQLKCVDLKSGEVKWEQPGFGAGNVILVNGALVALSDDGHVALVQPSTEAYKEQARFKAVTGKCWSTPAVADGRLYVRSTKEAACFELAQ
jgi:outer membrane protein assembly factor BamB